MKSRPWHSTAYVGIWICEKQITRPLQLLCNFHNLLWNGVCLWIHLALNDVCRGPNEDFAGVPMFTGMSFCRMSALLLFPHERVQMFLKVSLHEFTSSKMGWSPNKAVRARGRKAVRQGFPGDWNISFSPGTNFILLSENGSLLSQWLEMF